MSSVAKRLDGPRSHLVWRTWCGGSLGAGHIVLVLDGNQAYPSKKGQSSPTPTLRQCPLLTNGWIDQ